MSILSFAPVSLPNLCLGASIQSPTFWTLIAPLETILPEITPLESGSNRPITFTFDYQLKSLIYYHMEEYTSAQALLQDMQDKDSFAHQNIVPEEGLGESTFYEANSTRGATQMLQVFDRLSMKVSNSMEKESLLFADLGNCAGAPAKKQDTQSM